MFKMGFEPGTTDQEGAIEPGALTVWVRILLKVREDHSYSVRSEP